MDIVPRQGNHAVHKQATVPPQTAVAGLRELSRSLYWSARTCTGKNHELPTAGMAFDTAAIPHLISPEARLKKQAELRMRVAAPSMTGARRSGRPVHPEESDDLKVVFIGLQRTAKPTALAA